MEEEEEEKEEEEVIVIVVTLIEETIEKSSSLAGRSKSPMIEEQVLQVTPEETTARDPATIASKEEKMKMI